MDAFVLASAHEAFGLVLVEAMLAEVPIVATRVGGIPFVLDGGRSGVLIPPKQPQALAEAVTRVLTDEGLARCICARALERASYAFSAERYLADVARIYDELILS